MATEGDEKRLGPATTFYGTVACALCNIDGVELKGAPGLAFETWDPSNRFPMETPTLLFVIKSPPRISYFTALPLAAWMLTIGPVDMLAAGRGGGLLFAHRCM